MSVAADFHVPATLATHHLVAMASTAQTLMNAVQQVSALVYSLDRIARMKLQICKPATDGSCISSIHTSPHHGNTRLTSSLPALLYSAGAAVCGDNSDCTDTVGSYTCACKAGYASTSSPPGRGCLDINECTLGATEQGEQLLCQLLGIEEKLVDT